MKKEFKEEYDTGLMFAESTIDRKTLLVKNAVVMGAVSKNGYEYEEGAMKQLAQYLEGASGHIDHDMKDTGRGVLEMAVKYTNVRYEADKKKVYSDMQFVDTPDIRAEVFPRLEFFKNQLGNSIVAWGESEIREEKEYVTSISNTPMPHCDVVSDPATTAGLFESVIKRNEQEKNKQGGQNMTLKELLEKHPAELKEFAGTVLKEHKEEVKALEDAKELKTKIGNLEKRAEEAEKERDVLKAADSTRNLSEELNTQWKDAGLDAMPKAEDFKKGLLKRCGNKEEIAAEVKTYSDMFAEVTRNKKTFNFESSKQEDNDGKKPLKEITNKYDSEIEAQTKH